MALIFKFFNDISKEMNGVKGDKVLPPSINDGMLNNFVSYRSGNIVGKPIGDHIIPSLSTDRTVQYGYDKQLTQETISTKYIQQGDKQPKDYLIPVAVAVTALIVLSKIL